MQEGRGSDIKMLLGTAGLTESRYGVELRTPPNKSECANGSGLEIKPFRTLWNASRGVVGKRRRNVLGLGQPKIT